MSRKFKLTAAVVGLVAVMIATSHYLARLPVDIESGGCFQGRVPGLGDVQLNLYLNKGTPFGLLYREGIGNKGGYVEVEVCSNKLIRVIIPSEDFEHTNYVLEFRGGTNLAKIVGTSNCEKKASQPFTLTRTFQFLCMERKTGILLHRWGAHTPAATACCEFPLLPGRGQWDEILNRQILKEAKHGVCENTQLSLEQVWDDLRYEIGVPSQWEQQWQVRLLTNEIASFAVLQYYNPGGGNGNHSMWVGRNFVRRGSSLQDIDITNLFRPGAEWWETVKKYCENDLKNNGYESAARALSAPKETLDDFTLSPSCLQIYFNPYHLGSGGDGEFVVNVPYQIILPVLRP